MPMIDRSGASALIPEPITREILDGIRRESVALQYMRRLPNMSSNTQRQPILTMLPIADFVNGDSGMKVTTNMAWDKKVMVAGEVAAIVPIPQAVIDDSNYDIWGQARGALVEQFGRVIDRAILSVRNPKAPPEWPQPLIQGALDAHDVLSVGTGQDLAEDFSNLFAIMEEDGYEVTGVVAQRRIKTRLRNLRTTTGEPMYTPLTGTSPATIYGVPTHFAGQGVFPDQYTAALAGDWNSAVYSFRQDMTFQIFDTGVISDDEGKIVYNLLQQDMIAMRAVMRLGWQLANPIDIDRQDPSKNYYPFAVLGIPPDDYMG